MNKVVINTCYGGFALSREAVLLAREISGNPEWGGACIKGDKYEYGGREVPHDYGFCYDIPRHDPILLRVVAELGEKASRKLARLEIVKIPGSKYRIEEYDGMETVITPETDFEWVEI